RGSRPRPGPRAPRGRSCYVRFPRSSRLRFRAEGLPWGLGDSYDAPRIASARVLNMIPLRPRPGRRGPSRALTHESNSRPGEGYRVRYKMGVEYVTVYSIPV